VTRHRDWVVTIDAWPFLIAPTALAPPRLVVGPEWALADDRLLAAVRYAPEQIGVTAEGTAALRLARVGGAEFCVIYKVVPVHKSDYGIDGDEPAEDQINRELAALEGVAVRCGQDEAAQLDVGAADFEAVRQVVSGPYRDYWLSPQSFRTKAATSFSLTRTGDRVKLRVLEPWISPEDERSPSPRPIQPPTGTQPTGNTLALIAQPVAFPRRVGPPETARRRTIIAVAAAAAAIGIGIGVAIARPWEGPESVQQPRHLVGIATSDSTIKLSWATSGPKPDHYKLSANGRLITVPGDATGYRLTRLAPRTKYRVWIEAFGNGTRSAPSATFVISTPAAPVAS
jgi:Fibronectin type III domain